MVLGGGKDEDKQEKEGIDQEVKIEGEGGRDRRDKRWMWREEEGGK